jgi:peptidoglycan biosynthesis protein MviN/MurJ (putative lipid II flippase)
LTATGHIGDLFMVTLTVLVINVLLNILLIPVMGAKGCCISALISQGFYGFMTMLYSKQKTGIRIHFRSLLIYTFTGALLAGFFILCRSWPIVEWLMIIVAGLIAISIATMTKLIDIKTLIRQLPTGRIKG